MRRSLLLVVLLLSIAPVSAAAHGGEAAGTDMPAQALAVQALAMLDAHMGAMDARALVGAALSAENQDDVRLDRLRAADAALGRDDIAGARRELGAAFNPDDHHLIGTAFTGSDDGRLVTGIVGAVIFAAALLMLLRQTRSKATAADPPASRGAA